MRGNVKPASNVQLYPTHVPAYTPAPTYAAPSVQYPKPTGPAVTKEADKIAGKLKDIDTMKSAINQAKQVILSLDVAGYRKTLDMIGDLQMALRTARGELRDAERDMQVDEEPEKEKAGEEEAPMNE